MRHWLTFTVGGLFCLATAPLAMALGVGDPGQTSALNQPLHVVLPLTDVAGIEPEQVSVEVADDAAYRRAGLTRSALIDSLSAKVVSLEDRLAVVLDSPRRVREPFADLLLVVTWPDGRWQRDVALLFDPIDYADTRPLLDGDWPQDEVRRPAAADMSAAYALPMPPSGVASVWPARLAVHSGDSLSSLAGSLLPHRGLNRQSLMLALYRANPAAFVAEDIDRLRAGVSLDVPDAETVAAIPRNEALSSFHALSPHADSAARPTIDIEATAPPTSPATVISALPVIATLQQRVVDLVGETERQQASISTLRAERDRLQAALDADAAEAEPVSLPASPESAGKPAVTAPAMAQDGGVARSSPADTGATRPSTKTKPPAPSVWPSLADHLGWTGGAVLIALLGGWAWYRRRARPPETGSAGQSASEPPAMPSRPATLRRVAAAAVEVDAASISQADIYMAYGRHAEARDWLQECLAKREDADLRLGLIRVLGELREMDALESALGGFGGDATPEQRREAQALVDDYRARYVEESWQEATAGDEPDTTVAVDDVASLFDAEVSRLMEERDDDVDVPIVGQIAEEEGDRVASGAELAPSAVTIDYEAPVLQFETSRVETMDPEVPSSAMPHVDFPTLPEISTSSVKGRTVSRRGAMVDDPFTRLEPGRNESSDVSAGWDVEEVEFESQHRDNSRP